MRSISNRSRSSKDRRRRLAVAVRRAAPSTSSTKSAGLESIRQGTVGVGSAGYQRTTLDFNAPVTAVASGAALRLNAMWQDAGVAGRDVVNNEGWGLAPSLCDRSERSDALRDQLATRFSGQRAGLRACRGAPAPIRPPARCFRPARSRRRPRSTRANFYGLATTTSRTFEATWGRPVSITTSAGSDGAERHALRRDRAQLRHHGPAAAEPAAAAPGHAERGVHQPDEPCGGGHDGPHSARRLDGRGRWPGRDCDGELVADDQSTADECSISESLGTPLRRDAGVGRQPEPIQ